MKFQRIKIQTMGIICFLLTDLLSNNENYIKFRTIKFYVNLKKHPLSGHFCPHKYILYCIPLQKMKLSSMKCKTVFSLILMIFWLTNFSSLAQKSIIMQFRDGSESGLQLDQLQKITFSSGMLQLWSSSEIFQSYKVEDIHKIRFGLFSSVITPELKEKINVFPNPASDFLIIKNAPYENFTATIFSIDGHIQKQIIITNVNQPVDVSDLQPGIYLLCINQLTIKFSKL